MGTAGEGESSATACYTKSSIITAVSDLNTNYVLFWRNRHSYLEAALTHVFHWNIIGVVFTACYRAAHRGCQNMGKMT